MQSVGVWNRVDASIARYLGMLDTADRQDDQVAEMRVNRLGDRLETLRRQMREASGDGASGRGCA